MKSNISIVISFLCITFQIFPQTDYKVISSNFNSIIIEYTASYDTSRIKLGNMEFLRIDLQNGYLPDEQMPGEAAVPQRSITVGVPSEYGNTIEILNSSYKEFNGKIIPSGRPKMDKEMLIEEYFVGENYNNYKDSGELVSFGEFVIIRGLPANNFIIKPVKFFPLQNKIIIYDKILFRINFPPVKTNTTAEDHFLKEVVPNYDVAKFWKKEDVRKIRETAVSVLASGRWVRFEAPAEGFYKVDRATFSSWGFDVSSLDPRTIKIYNNGGKVLSERIEESHPYDLIENAVTVTGESDGRFDEGDIIIFYGRGIHFWDYDTISRAVSRYYTSYSKSNYYWITAGGSNGKRIQSKPGNLNVQSDYVQNTTQAFISWEEDMAKVAGTGRYYVGDLFSSSMQMHIYTNSLDNRVETVPVRYKFRFINASQNPFTLRVEENSNLLLTESLRGFGANRDYSAGYQFIRTMTYSNPIPSNTSVLKFQVSNMRSDSRGFLDNFEIYYEKYLAHSGEKLLFFSKDTTAVLEFRLAGLPPPTENIKVFDVTDFANVKEITEPLMWSGGDFWFQSAQTAGKASKFIALNTANFKIPVNAAAVDNQDIKGTTEEAKLIIITSKNFLEEARRLETYRESQSEYKLSASVVDVEKIFNEFGCGMGDVTAIRNFIQYSYDNWTIKPEYVLLFGDGHYDYKNIEGTNNNFIPTYQIPLIKNNSGSTVNSDLNLIDSYPMDDYFVRVDGNDPAVDLAIGRLNIQTPNEAAVVVDKIITYESVEGGTWQSLITLVADDGLTTDGDDNSLHTDQSEDLARLIPDYYNITKLYLAAYPTVVTGVGRTKPDVNKALINAINRGTIILNYIGHGSYEVWAHEFVFEKSSTISQLNNDKYFFLTAATCNFGQYDFTGTQSGTELLVLKENSGAIGAFTSTRPVYASPNKILNEEFYRRLLLSSREVDYLPVTIGKAYMLTKIGKTSQNDQKFHLYGDPTLRLHIPRYAAAVDSINGIPINPLSAPVQLRALSRTRVSGTIKRPDSTDWSDYSGEAILSVYDSERNTRIIEVVDTVNTNVYVMNIPGGILFNGLISVANGKFTGDFVVPKDISYENLNGKVVVYFYDKLNQTDGIGYTDKVRIGGSDTTAVNDGKGPDIEIHYDNPTSGSSSIVNPDSRLIVNLSDETGVNTTGTGIGHKLEGILNDNESSPIDFTEYFTGDLDAGGKSGIINYPFSGLEQGEYKIKVKAWDVFNNFSSEESFFTVVDGNELVIRDVFNYPNPFSTNTTFTFQKNQQSGIFNVKVKVYTVAGRMIKEIERMNISEDENFVKLDWDGRDEDGNLLANGVYLYKIIIKSADGQFNKSVLGKLAIIR